MSFWRGFPIHALVQNVIPAFINGAMSNVLFSKDWDKPENIPDPDAKKPEDWDEDMDGEWEPPMIPNPEYKV